MSNEEQIQHAIKMVVAKQTGYNDALYDGIDTSSMLECRCELCLKEYYDGWDDGINEIFGGKK